MVPTKVLRIRLGAYSDVSATKFGITPPMPSPAKNRSTPNSSGLDAKAPKKVKPLKRATQIKITFLRPILSAKVPKNIAPNIIPHSAVLANIPACTAVNDHSCISKGSTTP
ncbi:hypothetical protein D3C81_426890 [compost metagenome]